MEKLKAKHDHKLTDILKVGIFALFLLMPFLLFLPSCTYYAVNKYAEPTEDTIETYEERIVDFNQQVKNGNFVNSDDWVAQICSYEQLENGMRVYNSNGPQYSNNGLGQLISFIDGHKYYLRAHVFNNLLTDSRIFIGQPYGIKNAQTVEAQNSYYFSIITTMSSNTGNGYRFSIGGNSAGIPYDFNLYDVNVFDLTQMYGVGNEPTINEFESNYTLEYYPYIESEKQIITTETGTTTYKNVVNDINYNWQKLWNLPILNWTNNTILKQGLDNFTKVFGITNISYITNLLTYELIIVAIYIVIDIVITFFTWLTHLFNKE